MRVPNVVLRYVVLRYVEQDGDDLSEGCSGA
jgi:hypothetical protein